MKNKQNKPKHRAKIQKALDELVAHRILVKVERLDEPPLYIGRKDLTEYLLANGRDINFFLSAAGLQ